MKITRKIEMTVAENSTYIIRRSSSSGKIVCPKCGDAMLTAEQAAALFDIAQRRIFQIIETDAAHFTEIETGAVMICITSIGKTLGDGETFTPTNNSRRETAAR